MVVLNVLFTILPRVFHVLEVLVGAPHCCYSCGKGFQLGYDKGIEKPNVAEEVKITRYRQDKGSSKRVSP